MCGNSVSQEFHDDNKAWEARNNGTIIWND